MYKTIVKRIFDIILSGLGILVLILPMCVFALIVMIEDPGPAVFKQIRCGQGKKTFGLLKLRSMRLDTPHDVPTFELEDPEKYILKCGRWMRRFSIDELPQLFNVFIGQMSLIGPRPVVLAEENLIELREQYGANDVKPGITGWAQINGRDTLDAEHKAAMDGEYAKNISFQMDMKCLIVTVKKVLKHENVVEGKQW